MLRILLSYRHWISTWTGNVASYYVVVYQIMIQIHNRIDLSVFRRHIREMTRYTTNNNKKRMTIFIKYIWKRNLKNKQIIDLFL